MNSTGNLQYVSTGHRYEIDFLKVKGVGSCLLTDT